MIQKKSLVKNYYVLLKIPMFMNHYSSDPIFIDTLLTRLKFLDLFKYEDIKIIYETNANKKASTLNCKYLLAFILKSDIANQYIIKSILLGIFVDVDVSIKFFRSCKSLNNYLLYKSLIIFQ
jgi:hypothetical protein